MAEIAALFTRNRRREASLRHTPRNTAAVVLRVAIESLLLLMVVASPWAFGAVGEEGEFYLLSAVAGLLMLWALRSVVDSGVRWKAGPPTLCLALLFLSGVWQLAPLPTSVLAVVSPSTSAAYDRLLPSEREQLSEDHDAERSQVHVGSTLSFYPHATRQWLLRFLALALLFVVIRNNLSAVGNIQRFSIAAVINGTLLALFGIVQFFSAERGTLYWTFESDGAVFGPFVNRNHFAFYVNICIGLGLGLLLARGRSLSTERGPYRSGKQPIRAHWTRLLQDPISIWLAGALALMLSSVVFCLSRGGFLALLIASVTCVLCSMTCGRHRWKPGALLLAVASALGLTVWLGLEPIEARLATLWDGEAYRGGRGFLLGHCWPILSQYPLWGTGYGTFQYVEALYLHTPADVGSIYEHAHNDYLEDLIEGGLVRLTLRLAFIGLVLHAGYRAYRRSSEALVSAMALGFLFSLSTIVVHSFVEFGLFVPAIAVFATALAAHLCSLGDLTTEGQATASHSLDTPSVRTAPERAVAEVPPSNLRPLGGTATIVAACTMLSLSLVLYSHGARAVNVKELRRTARDLRSQSLDGLGARGEEIPYLHAAVSLVPDNALLRFLLADAYLESYQEQVRQAGSAPERFSNEQRAQAHRELLLPGLRQALLARDLCPLLPASQARLAFYRDEFVRAEPRQAYLLRTKILAPSDPQLWYFCGQQELTDGDRDEALRSWRRSLTLSDRYLFMIVDRGAAAFGADVLFDQLLPPRPVLLLNAAKHLYPGEGDGVERRQLLEKAFDAFPSTSDFGADELHAAAVLRRMLGQQGEAVATYRSALAESPLQSVWRYELATLLYEAGQYQECRREVQVILAQEPTNPAALQLGERASRKIAEQRLRHSAVPEAPLGDATY